MARRGMILAALAVPILAAGTAYYFMDSAPAQPELLLSKAVRREIRRMISTNGIIEPVGRLDVFAPMDGRVAGLSDVEGAEVVEGRRLVTLESSQLETSLAEARAALLRARQEELQMAAGPPKSEIAELEASIAECTLQLSQRRDDLRIEEGLLQKGAATREKVEGLRRQVRLLEIQAEGLAARKQALLNRYTAGEQDLVRQRVRELSRQVGLLESQAGGGMIDLPTGGVLYSLTVRSGEYVRQGQLLAQVYTPGRVRLRANVDEPDLAGIVRGQQVEVEWDGLPDRRWTGTVAEPANQVVALGNRSVGYVLCSLDDPSKELIPNLNVKVQIILSSKPAALVVPRTAVFSDNGRPTVLLSDGRSTRAQAVVLGLVTPEEVEIVQGLEEGSMVVTNPGDAARR